MKTLSKLSNTKTLIWSLKHFLRQKFAPAKSLPIDQIVLQSINLYCSSFCPSSCSSPLPPLPSPFQPFAQHPPPPIPSSSFLSPPLLFTHPFLLISSAPSLPLPSSSLTTPPTLVMLHCPLHVISLLPPEARTCCALAPLIAPHPLRVFRHWSGMMSSAAETIEPTPPPAPSSASPVTHAHRGSE